MTSQKVTFKSKQQAMEFAINTFVDGNQLTSAEQEAVQAAGVNIKQVEAYVRQALGSNEPEGED
jgi:hypothetical protein